MAWSYAIRLRDFLDVPREPGIYEIGYVKNSIFYPKYVGKAEKSLYNRLKSHYLEKGNKSVKDYLLNAQRDNLWCHWMKVTDPGFTEANLLNRYGLRDEGMYLFNNKLESIRTKRK